MKIEEKYINFVKKYHLYNESFFTNDFYHQCLHRARQEKLFNKSCEIRVGYYGMGGESDKILISESLEHKLVNGSRSSIAVYNFLAALRHIVVVLARIYIDFKIISHSKRRYKNLVLKHKRVVIIRTSAQQHHATQTFGGVKNTAFLYAPNRLAIKQNLDSNIKLSYLNYLKDLALWVLGGHDSAEDKPIIDKVDFSYALSELNLANILQKQIYSALSDLTSRKIKILYSYEVTSKDALMDAMVASLDRAKCYHIRIVDMAFKETPFVVPGNRALLKSSLLESSYRNFWVAEKSKFKKVSFFFRVSEKDLCAGPGTILICTSPINENLNYQFVKAVVEANRGKNFHIRFHPRLVFEIDGLDFGGAVAYDPRMQYPIIYTWPSSIIDEYWNEEVRINIFRPNISPYKHQISHYYSLPNVTVISTLDELS